MKSKTPKVLHPLCGKSMGAYVVELAHALCPENTVVVLGHQAQEVEAALRAQFPTLRWKVALQTEQRGTGHAVQQAIRCLPTPPNWALVLYGDVPLLREETVHALLEAAKKHTMALLTTQVENPTGYGRILRDSHSKQVLRIVEERDCTEAERAITEINAGICVLSKAVLEQALPALTPHNAQQELYLTDVVAWAAQQGSVGTVSVHSEEVQGINDRVDLARVTQTLYRRTAEKHMRQGVTFHAPDQTFVEPTVTIAADTTIGPNVNLRGTTVIGPNCHIEAGCVLTNTYVAEGCHIKPYSVLTDSRVESHSQVGPFAHMRPGSHIGPKARVGNFVELKNARLGEGTKANHLSYLGDATLGSHVNIGCGTITCNYDGYEKHHTVIEDGVFVGSDTQLVAPVRVGKDAVIAAGTTVTKDVPEGALALSRVPQVNKAGYREKKRQQQIRKTSSSKKQ